MQVDVIELERPFYYVVCYNAEKANNHRARWEIQHKLGDIMLCKKLVPPNGFIRAPENMPISSIRGDYPRLYETLRDQGLTHFPPKPERDDRSSES